MRGLRYLGLRFIPLLLAACTSVSVPVAPPVPTTENNAALTPTAPSLAASAPTSAAAPLEISINAHNAPLLPLLQQIAPQYSVLASPQLQPTVSLRARAPLAQLLVMLGNASNTDITLLDQVIAVRAQNETRLLQIPLRYQRAESLKQSLGADSSGRSSILSKTGWLLFDTRTNQLLVSDDAAHINRLQQIVAWLDVPTAQIEIEVQIVEADNGFGRNLGARLGILDKNPSGPLALGNDLNSVVNNTGQSTSGQIASSSAVNLSANGLNGFAAATFATSLFSAANQQFLNLELSALEAQGTGKVLSRPRVITADQLTALIEQGTELPYQQTLTNGTTQVSFRKANLRLEVQPQIIPNGHIVLTVDISKDTVGQETRAGFAIDTKHIKTQVSVENGGTVMLGGIEVQTERETETKVPLLGDLPGIGWLFKNKTKTVNKGELLVFITPKILPRPK